MESVPANRRGRPILGRAAIRDWLAAQCPGSSHGIFYLRPNGLAFSCRSALGEAFKMPMISRAKRSAAMPGWAALLLRLNVSSSPDYL